jgi:hypothetical protein
MRAPLIYTSFSEASVFASGASLSHVFSWELRALVIIVSPAALLTVVMQVGDANEIGVSCNVMCRRFTSYSHLAGTPGDERLADEISSIWTGQGLHVVRRNYDVLLSYPNATDPSIVELWDTSSGTLLHRSAAMEDVLTPEQNASDMIPPYNAYSPSGDVTVRSSTMYSCRLANEYFIATTNLHLCAVHRR